MQPAASGANNLLHDTEVVQHRHQRTDEHDDGQDIECNREAEALFHLVAKQENDSIVGIVDDVLHTGNDGVEYGTPLRHVKNKRRNAGLQRHSNSDRTPVDQLAI